MNRGDSASLCLARRSRRPQDTPINFMHGQLQLHQAINTLTPRNALALGLRVDSDASPKLRPALKSTACTTSSTRQFAMTVPYVPLSLPLVGSNLQAFRLRQDLLVENLALRQQLSVLKLETGGPNWPPSISSSG